MDDALRLRHRMIPYLHTMNWRASRTGLPLVEPMYWGSPDIDAAYHVPNEYMFGTELLAAPITEPMDKSSRRGKADVWLPQGDWFDFFTGRRYSASSPNGRRHIRTHGIASPGRRSRSAGPENMGFPVPRHYRQRHIRTGRRRIRRFGSPV